MIKRWIGRVLALAVIVGIIITTRTYFKNTVLPYAVAAQEQREKWDAQRAEIQQKQEEKEKQVSESENSETVTSSDNNESEDLTVSIFEPSEATGDDFFMDFSQFVMWESGEYDDITGQKEDNKRRLRYSNYIEIDCPEYCIKLTDGYSFIIVEYNAYKDFIRSCICQNDTTYCPTKDGYFFTVTLKKNEGEKSMSLGQWNGVFGDEFEATICTRKWLDEVYIKEGQLIFAEDVTYTVTDMVEWLLNNDDDTFAAWLWNYQVANDFYTLDYEDLYNGEKRLTFFVSSSDGDDSNTGLSNESPKKTLEFFSGMDNINILLKCNDMYEMTDSFKVGNNTLIAAYGEGSRPTLSYYRPLEVTFSQLTGYENVWVADLSDLDICNHRENKDNCNIGQLLIDGKLNWNRCVWSSKDEFDINWIIENKDNAWAVDWKQSVLYLYYEEDPNNIFIEYAPPSTGLILKKISNVEIKGIAVTGAGRHGCNITDCENIKISNCYFSHIGGSVLRQAGVRYGNAFQVWDSGKNIDISYNFASWIFDTCFTNQGSDGSAIEENISFTNNIGAHFFWGIETWGDGFSNNPFYNIVYSNNILYDNIDVTNPETYMHSGENTRLLGTKESEYISYRNGYKYHQMSSINVSNSGTGEVVLITNNLVCDSNRFLVWAKNDRNEESFSALLGNYFTSIVESDKACLLRFSQDDIKYYCRDIEFLNETNIWNIYTIKDYKTQEERKNVFTSFLGRMYGR